MRYKMEIHTLVDALLLAHALEKRQVRMEKIKREFSEFINLKR